MDLHEDLGLRQRLETKRRVQTMSVSRREDESAKTLEIWMRNHFSHQPLR